MPVSVVRSTSTVGLPRESRISRAWTEAIVATLSDVVEEVGVGVFMPEKGAKASVEPDGWRKYAKERAKHSQKVSIPEER